MAGSGDELHLFPTTHWSLVRRSGADPSAAQREALGDLLRRYQAAFRTFVAVRFSLPPDRADDLVQGFILSRLLERNLAAGARADRGKFRNLLMTALEGYAIDQRRRATAAKRRFENDAGGGVPVSDVTVAGAAATATVGGGRVPDDPAAAFDVAWASAAVRQAVERMRQVTEPVRPDLWGVFADRVLGPAFDGQQPTAYAELVGRLGFADEGQASNALHTAKRIFARNLRGVVAEYALTADEVDREIADLRAVLANGGGR